MKTRWAGIAVNALLGLGALVALTPVLWMLSVSLMAPGSSEALPPPLLPAQPTWHNYATLFTRAGMGGYLVNSLLVSGAITALSLACNVGAGYAFAKLRFAGRQAVFRGLLGTLLVPAQVAMLPLFLLFKATGLVNSYTAVVLPAGASLFGIYLVRDYARGVSDAMLEAARLEGAGEWCVFARIVLPQLKPVLVTLALVSFLTAWNDFMWPLIVLTGQAHYTLPIGLASLAREHAQDTELMMAGAVVTTLPVLALFLALQRAYLQGLPLNGWRE